jgi:hypothetical protein
MSQHDFTISRDEAEALIDLMEGAPVNRPDLLLEFGRELREAFGMLPWPPEVESAVFGMAAAGR